MDKLELRSVSVLNADSKQVAIPDYVEFYINDKPLSELINKTFKPEDAVLSKFTSVLGTMELTNFDRLKVKQLLGNKITKADVNTLFPTPHFDQAPIFDELKLPEILVYCCAECADYKCGGYSIQLQPGPDTIGWKLVSGDQKLEFTFSKKEYISELSGYIAELE